MDAVYIETSIISHVTARPGTDVRIAAIQQQAQEWWFRKRQNFELVTSQLVIDEAARGDRLAASERLRRLDGLPTVPINDSVRALALAIVSESVIPQKAAADALHVAAAAVAGVQCRLTLNCRHIANAPELPRVYRLLGKYRCGQLLICTPAEFPGGDENDGKKSNP